MEQLALIAAEPHLTDRQKEALTFLRAAGIDGLTSVELGRLMGVHPDYARSNGVAWLKALRREGVARQLKGGIWRSVTTDTADDTRLLPGMTDEIPY